MLKKSAYLLFVFFYSTYIFSQSTEERKSITRKGNIYGGLTVSFEVNHVENDDRLLVLIEDRQNNSFSINLNSGYFIQDNWAFGGQLSYGNNKRTGNEINLQNVFQQVSVASESWGLYGSMKNYIPLDPRSRFYLFNNLLLGGKIENTLSETVAEDILTRMYTQNRLVELKIVPGIAVNVIKGFTVEAGAEIAGVKSSWSTTEVNGVETTKTTKVSADLSINLLRLSLGFYYYFGIGKSK